MFHPPSACPGRRDDLEHLRPRDDFLAVLEQAIEIAAVGRERFEPVLLTSAALLGMVTGSALCSAQRLTRRFAEFVMLTGLFVLARLLPLMWTTLDAVLAFAAALFFARRNTVLAHGHIRSIRGYGDPRFAGSMGRKSRVRRGCRHQGLLRAASSDHRPRGAAVRHALHVHSVKDLDARLVLGAGLFGIGRA